jgi:hypothetical protein
LVSLGFVDAKSDTLLFVYHRGADSAYLLLYVDNIVLTASSLKLLQHTTTALQQQFMMKDLGPLHHFLGVSKEQRYDNFFLHPCQYARDILEHTGMSDSSHAPLRSTLRPRSPPTCPPSPPINDLTAYRSLAWAL